MVLLFVVSLGRFDEVCSPRWPVSTAAASARATQATLGFYAAAASVLQSLADASEVNKTLVMCSGGIERLVSQVANGIGHCHGWSAVTAASALAALASGGDSGKYP